MPPPSLIAAGIMQLLVATTNPGKVKEFREMLGHTGVSFSDLSAHPGTVGRVQLGEMEIRDPDGRTASRVV